jgi:hypothetical protein
MRLPSGALTGVRPLRTDNRGAEQKYSLGDPSAKTGGKPFEQQASELDLLATISTLPADAPYPAAQPEMPIERTWFSFNWFSDFFKDMTEEACSEDLLNRTVHSIDLPSFLDESRDEKHPWRPISTKHVSSLYEKIMQHKNANRLSPDFVLPSRNKVCRYLSGYFGYFSPHAPVIHVQSFDFESYSRSSLMSLAYFSGYTIIYSLTGCVVC